MVSAWVGLYLLGLVLAPSRLGRLPVWADLPALAPSTVRDLARAALSLGLAWLLTRALRHAWRVSGELGRLMRLGVSASLLGPLLHAGRELVRRTGEGRSLEGDSATLLAAELSSTHWGIPWLALGYLVALVGLALGCATLTARAADDRGLSPRATQALSWAVGLLTLAALTRPLVYYATGDDLLRSQAAGPQLIEARHPGALA